MVSGSFSDKYESGYESETGVGNVGAGDGVDGGADGSVPEPARREVTVAVVVVTNGLSWSTVAVAPTSCFFSTRLRPPRCLGVVAVGLVVVFVVGLVVVVFGGEAEEGVVWVLVLAVALLE